MKIARPRNRTRVLQNVFANTQGIQHGFCYTLQFDQEASTVAFEPNDAADITTVVRTRRKIPGHLPVYMFEAHVPDAADLPPASRIGAPVQSLLHPCYNTHAGLQADLSVAP